MSASMDDKPFNVPLVDRGRMRPRLARQSVSYHGPGEARHDRRRHRRAVSLPRPARRPGDPLRRRRRPAGLLLARRRLCRPQGRVARMVADNDDGQPQAGAAALPRSRPRQPARRPRALPLPERRATRSSASTAPTSPGASASRSRRAASACSTRTWSTSTTACRSARRCWCGATAAGGCESHASSAARPPTYAGRSWQTARCSGASRSSMRSRHPHAALRRKAEGASRRSRAPDAVARAFRIGTSAVQVAFSLGMVQASGTFAGATPIGRHDDAVGLHLR